MKRTSFVRRISEQPQSRIVVSIVVVSIVRPLRNTCTGICIKVIQTSKKHPPCRPARRDSTPSGVAANMETTVHVTRDINMKLQLIRPRTFMVKRESSFGRSGVWFRFFQVGFLDNETI